MWYRFRCSTSRDSGNTSVSDIRIPINRNDHLATAVLNNGFRYAVSKISSYVMTYNDNDAFVHTLINETAVLTASCSWDQGLLN